MATTLELTGLICRCVSEGERQEYERQDAMELAEQAMGGHLTPAEVSRFWSDRAVDFIAAEPGRWIALLGRKLILLWNRTEVLDTESQETYAEWSWPVRFGAWAGNFGVLVPWPLLVSG